MPSDSSVLLVAKDDELRRTQQPSKAKSEFFGESDSLRRIGSWGGGNMETALSTIKLELKESFKNAVTDFIIRGDYPPYVYQHCFSTFANSLRQYPSECFDDYWLAQATTSIVFKKNIGAIRSFFIQWNDSSPTSVSKAKPARPDYLVLICKGDKLVVDTIEKDREYLVRTYTAAQQAIKNGERSVSR